MQYRYPTYFQAKMATIKLWGRTCAICGREIRGAPVIHHLLLSRRYKIAKSDIRNLVPVHPPEEAPCHKVAHGGGKSIAANSLYKVLGDGDPFQGWLTVIDAVDEWDLDFMVEIPPIKEVE